MDRGAHGVPRVGHDLVTEPPPPPQNYSRGWRDHTELSGIVLRTVLQRAGTQKALLSFISGHYQLDGKNIMEIPDSEAMVLASRSSGSSPSVVSPSLLPSGCRNPKCIWEL